MILRHTVPLLAAVALFSCSSSKNSKGLQEQVTTWQKDSIAIDGNDADWPEAWVVPGEKEAYAAHLSNDREHLYIQLVSSNENTIQRILRGGLTVYLNAYGVKEENGSAGISFPTGNRVKKDGRMLNDRPELQQDRHMALNAVADYALFGFRTVKTPENYDYGKPNPEGIEIAVGLNNANALIYEAKIPLKSFLSAPQLINPSRRTLAVELVLEDIPGQPGSRGGGGGFSIGGGLGIGSFGTGGGVGLSIGTDALTGIGGRKKGKPIKQWIVTTMQRGPQTP